MRKWIPQFFLNRDGDPSRPLLQVLSCDKKNAALPHCYMTYTDRVIIVVYAYILYRLKICLMKPIYRNYKKTMPSADTSGLR